MYYTVRSEEEGMRYARAGLSTPSYEEVTWLLFPFNVASIHHWVLVLD
jgi:hypothetical protein